MSTNISVKEAKAALKKIKLLTPTHQKTDDEFMMSRKETVFFMAEELIRMTRLGFTIKELAAALADQNIPIKYATLSRYLKEYQLEQKKVSPEESKQQLEADGDAKAEPESFDQDSESSHLATPENPNSALSDSISRVGADEDNPHGSPEKSELDHEAPDFQNWGRDEDNPTRACALDPLERQEEIVVPI